MIKFEKSHINTNSSTGIDKDFSVISEISEKIEEVDSASEVGSVSILSGIYAL